MRRAMNPINEMGICQKCDTKREALERYGSKTTIRQCCVCKKHTDSYDSRASGEIVCGQECNDIMTIVNKVQKDKSGRTFEEIMKEKIKLMVDRQMNTDFEDDEYEIEKLSKMVNKYLNKEFEDTPFYPKQERIEILQKKLPLELAEMVVENIGENVELLNTVPINTIMSNIQWSEGSSITQPWEISQEFLWKDQ